MDKFWKVLKKKYGDKAPTPEDVKREWEKFKENDPEKLPEVPDDGAVG